MSRSIVQMDSAHGGVASDGDQSAHGSIANMSTHSWVVRQWALHECHVVDWIEGCKNPRLPECLRLRSAFQPMPFRSMMLRLTTVV